MILDESGRSQKPSVRRTWAPRGKTPVLKHRFNWKRLAITGALALSPARDRLRFFLSVKPGSVDSLSVVAFVRSLRRHVRGRVLLLWDHLSAHISGQTKTWLRTQRHWLGVEHLPAYAPELNPLEYCWSNLDAHELGNFAPDDLGALKAAVCRGARRIRRNPKLMKGFLKHSPLFQRMSL